MDQNEQELVDNAIKRLLAGETIYGMYTYDHGLEIPLASVSHLRYAQGVFLFTNELQSMDNGEVQRKEEKTRNEEQARRILLNDSALHSALKR